MDATHAAEHGAEHAAGGISTPELPSFFSAFDKVIEAEWGAHTLHFLHQAIYPLAFAVIAALIFLVIVLVGTRKTEKIPRGLQAFLELIYIKLDNFVVGIIGPEGKKFTPFIGTLFIYIVMMNLLGLIPLFHSPTSKLNTTLSLALVVFFGTQIVGIKYNGLIGYCKHFVGEPTWLAPLNIPLHLIDQLVRPVSLSLRLFGNIMGEDTAIAVMTSLAVVLGAFSFMAPFQLPMMLLAVLTSFIQALVFSILACIYFTEAIGHHGDGEHGDEAEAH